MRKIGLVVDFRLHRRCARGRLILVLVEQNRFRHRATIERRPVVDLSLQFRPADLLMQFPVAMLTVLAAVTGDTAARTCFDRFATTMPTLLDDDVETPSGQSSTVRTYLGPVFLSIEKGIGLFEGLSLQPLVLFTFAQEKFVGFLLGL